MHNPQMHAVHRLCRARQTRESGMALVLVLLLLLLVSAIGLGLIYMSNTESSINSNYRDSQLAFFAMRGGLEEVRDRMRTNTPFAPPTYAVLAPPTTMPPNANSIVYLINPGGPTDVVPDPKTAGNLYFDDEFCHENFVGDGVANSGANVPCPWTAAPPAGAVAAYVNSITPNTSTNSSLKYKWARITLKQNGTFAIPSTNVAQYVDSGVVAGDPVCYQSLTGQEIPLSKVPGGLTPHALQRMPMGKMPARCMW